jgi:hypothetical protein
MKKAKTTLKTSEDKTTLKTIEDKPTLKTSEDKTTPKTSEGKTTLETSDATAEQANISLTVLFRYHLLSYLSFSAASQDQAKDRFCSQP